MHDIDDHEQEVLDKLGADFIQALEHKDAGRVDDAEELLREIIRREPRLGEPHLELARLLLDLDRVADAEPHAREAIAHLENTGVWIEDIPEGIVRGLAHAVLAECLRRRADEEDVIFGDPDAFRALIAEAQRNFARAHELDPASEYASYHAFFLGVGQEQAAEEDPDDAAPFSGVEPAEA